MGRAAAAAVGCGGRATPTSHTNISYITPSINMELRTVSVGAPSQFDPRVKLPQFFYAIYVVMGSHVNQRRGRGTYVLSSFGNFV